MNETDFINAAIRSNAAAWFESDHCRIYFKDRKKGLQRPRCNYLQTKIQRTIDRFEDLGLPIRIIGLKPRQKGSTTFFSAQDYCFLRRHSASAIVIGAQYSQVSECWDMLQVYSKNDRFDWKNTGEINAKDGKWSNGSKLRPETAKDATAGIGGTHQCLHAFEVAKWAKHGVANAGIVLANILKCVPDLPDTMVILESTAEGNSGEFHDRFVSAPDAEQFISGEVEIQAGSYVRLFAPWFEFEDSAMRLEPEQKKEIEDTLDADSEYAGERNLCETYGVRDGDGVFRLGSSVEGFDVWEQLAWRRYAIRVLCEKDVNIFNKDYPESWEKAFQLSGSLRFNSTGVSILRQRATKIMPMHGILEDADGRVAFRQTEKNEATVTIFEKPTPGYRYILPIDPMTGITQVSGLDPDFHSAFVMRKGIWDSTGKWVRPATAARIIPCRWEIDVLTETAWRLARYYGSRSGCKIVIEMNQDRGATERLKDKGADLYIREIFNQREFKTTLALGFQTSERTRETLIDNIAGRIREWDKPGDGLDVWCLHAVSQFENFVRKDNGRSEAAEGNHDDDVLAISLGLHLIDHATTYTPDRSGPMSHEMSLMHPPSPAGGAPSAYS